MAIASGKLLIAGEHPNQDASVALASSIDRIRGLKIWEILVPTLKFCPIFINLDIFLGDLVSSAKARPFFS